MDKIEKICQEIKRLRKEIKDDKDPLAPNQKAGYLFALVDMESFLDTLSEEPNKSLEEEVKNYFQGYWPGTETVEQCNTDLHFTPPAIIRLARYFYELGKKQ